MRLYLIDKSGAEEVQYKELSSSKGLQLASYSVEAIVQGDWSGFTVKQYQEAVAVMCIDESPSADIEAALLRCHLRTYMAHKQDEIKGDDIAGYVLLPAERLSDVKAPPFVKGLVGAEYFYKKEKE